MMPRASKLTCREVHDEVGGGDAGRLKGADLAVVSRRNRIPLKLTMRLFDIVIKRVVPRAAGDMMPREIGR